MPEGKTGGRQSERKFGEHRNSIGHAIHLPGADPELKRKFYANIKKQADEASIMEAWAREGFGSAMAGDD
jgi:hypothetical protein